jgi:hypothetical protein
MSYTYTSECRTLRSSGRNVLAGVLVCSCFAFLFFPVFQPLPDRFRIRRLLSSLSPFPTRDSRSSHDPLRPGRSCVLALRMRSEFLPVLEVKSASAGTRGQFE